MCQKDRRADLPEQIQNRIAIQRLLDREIINRRHLRSVELIEHGIARRRLSGPLGVQMCLRPIVILLRSDESASRKVDTPVTCRTVKVGLKCRSASSDLINHVNGVALPQKVLGPTLPAIWGS